MKWSRGWSVAGVLACSLAAPAPAPAQTGAAPAADTGTQRARELFEHGAALAREGRWHDALAAFEQSATLRSHATTTYNVGYCERALGHATRARKYFAQALRENATRGGGELSSDLQGATEQYLREVEAQVATADVTIDPADASITVDGRPLELDSQPGAPPVLFAGTRDPGDGQAPPSGTFVLRIDPGSHVFAVTARDGRSRVVDERFTAGEHRTLRIALPPRAASAPDRQPRSGSVMLDRAPHGWTSQHTWAVVVAGAGVAAIAGGTYFGLRAGSRWHDAKAACPGLTACPDDRGSQLSADAKRDGNLATVAFVGGAAALGGAAVLWLTAPSLHSERPAVGAAILPGSAAIAVHGAF